MVISAVGVVVMLRPWGREGRVLPVQRILSPVLLVTAFGVLAYSVMG
ncbi:hypothetical protein [Streptomonospora alba]|nr:hypothetical protein [Streptomonospora alba]